MVTVVEPAAPGRHDAAAAVPNALDDRRVGPSHRARSASVRFGRAELAIALAVVAMTGGAIVGKDLLAGRKIGVSDGREPGERAHIVGDGLDLGALEHAVAAECRHHWRPGRVSRSPERMPCRMVCAMSSSLPPQSQSSSLRLG